MPTPFEISDRYVTELAALVPELATSLGLPGPHDSWSHHGLEGVEAVIDLVRSTRQRLGRHLDDADRRQRTAARVLAASLDLRIDDYESGDHLEDLAHLASSFRGLRSVFDTMDKETATGWDDIASRLEGLRIAFEQYAGRLEAGRAAGRAVARRQVESVIGQARALAGADGAYRRLEDQASAAGHGSRRLTAAIDTACAAAAGFTDYLERTYLPDARARDAVGRDRYVRSAERFLGMDLDPEQAYEWGWVELDRLIREMTALGEEIEPGAGLQVVIDALEEHDELVAPSREEFCHVIQQRLAQAVRDLAGVHFDVDARISAVTVQIAPPGGALGAYYVRPSEDFRRPGGVWYSVGDQTRFPLYHQISTAYHEGFPGHHLQIATAMTRSDQLSRAQRVLVWYPGYGEGWAMYAERLMGELGYFERPELLFGMLAKQMYRAVRVVVDIGLHLEKSIPDRAPLHPGEAWSYEIAVEYMHRFGFRTDDQAHAEVLRYLGWPGQAIAYKLGEREIMAMREETRARLGSAFDLGSFHAEVLGNGPMGLAQLRTELAERL